MPIFKDPMLIRQIIMDHYNYPRNKKLVDDERYTLVNLDSVACIDNIDLQVLICNKVIKDIRFDGIACAISTASTSILTQLMKDKTIDDANEIIDNYLNMLYEKPFNEDLLGEALAFINTSKQANRISCATLSWLGLKKIINKEEA